MRIIGLSLCALVGCSAARVGADPSSTTTVVRSPPAVLDAASVRDAAPVEPQDVAALPVACLDSRAASQLLSCAPTDRGATVPWNEQRWRALTAPSSGSRRSSRSMAPRPLTDDELELVSLSSAFLCLDQQGAQRGQVLYRLARVYYEAQQFGVAAALFRLIVLDSGPEAVARDIREYSTDLYLESLNVLGSRAEPRRPACFETMREDLPRIHSSLCGVRRGASEDLCDRVALILCQLDARALGEGSDVCGRIRR